MRTPDTIQIKYIIHHAHLEYQIKLTQVIYSFLKKSNNRINPKGLEKCIIWQMFLPKITNHEPYMARLNLRVKALRVKARAQNVVVNVKQRTINDALNK